MRQRIYELLLIGLIISGIHQSAFSQYHFVQGTVWFANGDTVKGWIDNGNWNNITNRIRFTTDPDQTSGVIYDPSDIAGFSIKDKIFISYVNHIDSAHVIIRTTSSALNPPEIWDHLFLLLLVKGPLSLYYSEDERGVPHYFLKDENRLVELHYFQFNFYTKGLDRGIFQETEMHVIERHEYKQQLLKAFSDCPAVYRQLAGTDTRFVKRTLVKWVKTYNNSCKQQAREESLK